MPDSRFETRGCLPDTNSTLTSYLVSKDDHTRKQDMACGMWRMRKCSSVLSQLYYVALLPTMTTLPHSVVAAHAQHYDNAGR